MIKKTCLTFCYAHSVMFLTCMILSALCLYAQSDTSKIWVGTWGTAPQRVEPGNVPPSPGLNNNSLRQIVRASIGGDTIRVKFSNLFSETPVTLNSVKIAVSAGGRTIYDSTDVKLTFGGSPEVTMDSGGVAISDPIAFNLQPRTDIAITIYFGQTSSFITGHPGSRTTSYLLAGNDTSVTDFTGAVSTDHWYIITGIDVLTEPTSSCISVIGNSITDGRGTTTNLQNRWTDILSERLIANPGTEKVGVLNMGLGGNCVLSFCLGPAAIDRFKRDVLEQAGVRAGIVFEGVNDIGGVNTFAEVAPVTNNLIAAYKMMIDSAHAKGILLYGATILPFKGNGYYNAYSEYCRNKVNDWIRNSGRFDGVIDFDQYFRNPNDPASLGFATYQNDGLHPDAAGYKMMGDSVDLSLFVGIDTVYPAIDTTGFEAFYFEPECATVGENWKFYRNPAIASNGGYISIEPGFNNPTEASNLAVDAVSVNFTVSHDTTYNVYARLNCEGDDNDAFWVKMEGGDFALVDDLSTDGWEWRHLGSYDLSAGDQTLVITHAEDGAFIDKIFISNDTLVPSGYGLTADILCLPDTVTVIIDIEDRVIESDSYVLTQNYPNPFNDNTSIQFAIKKNAYVSLKVYSLVGEEIAELAGKNYSAGSHKVDFDATAVPQGIYYYTMRTDNFSVSRKMIIKEK